MGVKIGGWEGGGSGDGLFVGDIWKRMCFCVFRIVR